VRKSILLLPVCMLVLAMSELEWIPYLSWGETIQRVFFGGIILMGIIALGHTFVWGKIGPWMSGKVICRNKSNDDQS